MGIAFFTITNLFAPLQALATRLMPTHKTPNVHSQRRPLCMDTAYRSGVLGSAAHTFPVRVGTGKDAAKVVRRTLQLRVVRPVEAGVPVGRTGRIVISGRMADVCAELERLAAVEAAQDSLVHH